MLGEILEFVDSTMFAGNRQHSDVDLRPSMREMIDQAIWKQIERHLGEPSPTHRAAEEMLLQEIALTLDLL